MAPAPETLFTRPNSPDFSDLCWDRPLAEWPADCPRLVEAPRGESRHPVVFVNDATGLYALKELPLGIAQKEYENLKQMEEARLPVVMPVGYALTHTAQGDASVLITRYLEHALPYRMLFMQPRSPGDAAARYYENLLDAMAGLLVQLHLVGVFWGDCSLSNTLFRRDAGALQAYLVDAETAEIYLPRLMPTLRHHDLEIMEENVMGDLADLAARGQLPENLPVAEMGASIRQRYRSLWEEITREEIISPDEQYRIQERIRALNALGFSVRDVSMQPAQNGAKLRLRIFVTDRNFHRDQLLSLTGVDAEEMQARQLMNEIQQLKATLSHEQNRSLPLSVAAYHWLQNIYQPVIAQLQPLMLRKSEANENFTPAELYCQILEHKWYLSERARRDVGHWVAVSDYLTHIAGLPPAAENESPK